MKHFSALMTMLFCILISGHIYGQAAGENYFARGTKVNAIYLENYNSLDDDREITLTQLNAESGSYLPYGFSLNGNLYLLMAQGERILEDTQPQEKLEANTFGGGFSGFLRWDFLRYKGHSLFVESGVGMVFTTEDLPPGGTFWNFTRRRGAGAAIRVHQDARLLLGWRDMHISNGKGFGHPRNPSYDATSFYVGLRF